MGKSRDKGKDKGKEKKKKKKVTVPGEAAGSTGKKK